MISFCAAYKIQYNSSRVVTERDGTVRDGANVGAVATRGGSGGVEGGGIRYAF